jgi:hypothetical protein
MDDVDKPPSFDAGEAPRRSISSLGLFVETLRKRLVDVALEWEQAFGNAPHITAALSEFGAAQLVGFSLADYCESMKGTTAVHRGFDFRYDP